ncbi:uncharacterized protein Z520_11860 [Fonsecaea multimorphosa CBS 102226]|uniref:SNF7 family protein n=1 Tax=Fonsecaea multimorphosa CBS 102226 TaxID=1442371 RepID=A0A0D2I572_9EURO|nr:uncharacterized protein Z520_11860 [Fonsecaea multimorphosa CBS 102226]KIX92386.1 hypothetical protein Z520_11860 [Fonsecaea multimorphosa CBS 102226]OAL17758.1 hypothetical protein AYO22_11286 [Fonsecaea multimorphosa]
MSPLLDWLLAHEPSFRKTRLPSLYSDLNVQRTSNPEGYTANVDAWSSALIHAAVAGQIPGGEHHLILQTNDELLNALASPTYGKPSGLGSVLDECVRQGKMIDLQDFITSERSIYSRSWIPSPWAVLRWSLQKAGLSWSSGWELSGSRLKAGKLALVPALEEVWTRLSAAGEGTRSQTMTDRVMTREMFLRDVNSVLNQAGGEMITGPGSLSNQDLEVLLRYLSRDKQVLSYDGSTVKFKPPSSTTAPEPITQEDRSIASLKSLIEDLSQKTTTLSTRIVALQSQASAAVKSGNKPSALSALRSKKLAERALQQRLDTLHQLEEIYTKIETAVDQVEILAVMESSASVLKTLNKRIGGVERVEDVLESLREEVSKVDEVSSVMAEPVDQKAVLDEEEVDEELAAMEREERERTKKVEEDKTRQKLQELDALEQLRKERERERKPELEMQQGEHAEDRESEQALSTSIEKLQRLDIDEHTNTEAPAGAQGQHQQRHTEKIAQQAS